MKIKTKKIILFLLITITALMLCNPVQAATSYTVELTSSNTTVKAGEQIEITIKVKDIVDITGGIAGLSAKLEYDETKLERVGEGQSLNGFMLVEGNTIELAKYPGVTNETEIAKFTFKVKENTIGEAQIKLSGIEVANGTDTFALGKDVIKTISIESVKPPVEEKSNNNLVSISVDGKKIANFKKDTLTYTLEAVENNKTSIEITAQAEDSKAKITGTGKKNLNVGKNSFEIKVKAEDGTEKVYKVNVERKAANNNNTNTDTNTNTNANTNKPNNQNPGTQQPSNNNAKPDNTQATTKIPKAGTETNIIICIVVAIVVGVVSFIQVKKLSDI